MTLQQRLQYALSLRGETLVRHQGDFIVMTRDNGGYYFIGPSGALRVGRVKSATSSLTDTRFYRSLLAECEIVHPAPIDIDEELTL